jgi:hypothetical protein
LQSAVLVRASRRSSVVREVHSQGSFSDSGSSETSDSATSPRRQLRTSVRSPPGKWEEQPCFLRTYDHPPESSRGSRERGASSPASSALGLIEEESDSHRGQYPDADGAVAATCEIWEAARATSAAPFYFPSIVIDGREMYDGGFGTNNPSVQALLTEVLPVEGSAENLRDAVFVSIGTGSSRAEPDAEEENDNVAGGIRKDGSIRRSQSFGPGASLGGVLNTARSLVGVARGAVAAVTDTAMAHAQMKSLNPTMGIVYFRFNVPGIRDLALDDTSAMNRVTDATQRYLDRPSVSKRLRDCAERLVRNRRARR